MGIGLADEHVELHRSITGTLERLGGTALCREVLDAPTETVPDAVGAFAAEGWLGLGIDEALGGQGGTVAEAVIVAEVLGAQLTPGALVPTLIAALAAGATREVDRELTHALASGSLAATVVLGQSLSADAMPDGSVIVRGSLKGVPSVGVCDLALVQLGAPDGAGWAFLDLHDGAVTVDGSRPSLDLIRRAGDVTVEGVTLPANRVLSGLGSGYVADLARTLLAAEVCGAARAALDVAVDHAKNRIQFGRPIGQFQGVKHRLASCCIAVEELTAAVWDAALAMDGAAPAERSLAAAVAAALAATVGPRAARDAIQVLGGMGFTWEHDAHLYLRRAISTRQILGGESALLNEVCDAAISGTRRTLGVELPENAAAIRDEITPIVQKVAAAATDDERRAVLGESGLMFPHFPEPYGRAASAIEQLVIDQVMADLGVRRPPAHVASWALPTLIAHGTVAQQERFVMPTLRGEILWCQLFSEPGAGSDLAALTTKATKVDGGWRIDGQKVWTSTAQWAHYGILLARSNPDAPKHGGITYFVLDMKAPGLDIRPLREITGDSLFNEVFLDGVFIPDDCVVGAVDEGWTLARTTLANERVALASSSAFSGLLEQVVAIAAAEQRASGTVSLSGAIGELLVEAQALALMRQRQTIRSLSGLAPGSEASLAKLLGAEHEQRVADVAVAALGLDALYTDGDAKAAGRNILHTLCLTIAGGTSEVQRNVIGERLLGLPRDPEPQSPKR